MSGPFRSPTRFHHARSSLRARFCVLARHLSFLKIYYNILSKFYNIDDVNLLFSKLLWLQEIHFHHNTRASRSIFIIKKRSCDLRFEGKKCADENSYTFFKQTIWNSDAFFCISFRWKSRIFNFQWYYLNSVNLNQSNFHWRISGKKFFLLLNQLIFIEVISGLLLIHSSLCLAIWIS